MTKYLGILRISFINRLDYKQELLMSLFIGILVFTGQAVFWSAVFWDREIVKGFTLSQILLYYLFARIVSQVIDSKLGFKLSQMMISGQISTLLLKPMDFKKYLFFDELGRISLDILSKLSLYLIIFILVFKSLPINYTQIPIFTLAIILSLFISYGVFFLTGCIAFITINATSLNYAIRRIILFLSGGIIPLSFFPHGVRNILELLPFQYIFDLPIKILTSEISTTEILTGICIQILWIALLWVLITNTFKHFAKYNESVGL